MKVKCPMFLTDGDGGCRRITCGKSCDMHGFIAVEIPTSDLIAELEKRRPCERCAYQQGHPVTCESCVWSSIIESNNFKEAK